MIPAMWQADDPENPRRLRVLCQALHEDMVLLGHRRLAAYKLFGEEHAIYGDITRAGQALVAAHQACLQLIAAEEAQEGQEDA